MPDDNILVANNNGDIVMHDPSGTVLRVVTSLSRYGMSYRFPQRIAVSQDGRDLWIASMSICDGDGYLLRVSMADGSELSRRELQTNNADALVVGAYPASVAPIPTISPALLEGLGLMLAALAALKLRA